MSVDENHLRELLKGARLLRRPLSVPACVIDTNVVLDLLYFSDPKSESLEKALQSRSIIAVGHYDTLYEFCDVIARAQFKLSEEEQEELIGRWLSLHEILDEPLHDCAFCKDPDDDKFFNLAQGCSAAFLISKDKKVLKARGKAKRFGCAVIKPENFRI